MKKHPWKSSMHSMFVKVPPDWMYYPRSRIRIQTLPKNHKALSPMKTVKENQQHESFI